MAAPGPAADSLRHRWTVGLRYAGEPNFYGFGKFLPTVGYQWRPRWEVEVGGAYRNNRYEGSATGFTVDGKQLDYQYHGQTRWTVVPVRVRYTLTRRAERRLQFDALGGVALSFGRNSWEQIELENAVETYRYQAQARSFYGLVGLGLGGRYGLGPSRRLELAAEWTLHQQLVHRFRPDYGTNRSRFGPVGYWGLGLRYKL
ncbi:hypothetical protein LJ737_16515 [Hymenobacter sp. 15J16-1T3B]|uniref:hypothetical protein n=1 Tax=Hymenobacter sp. 15J16-1T3B TaxID=2886941 RepID=UPI001D1194A5|nr:hypothetical protein [Hymenobacter sp. 15J16-1T3B]MCC3158848.1 hypothetical protein [Hymenobacter sp. 15J16-1T3B]